MKLPDGWSVVWSGRMPLLPERDEHVDSRLGLLPTLEEDIPLTASKQRSNRLYVMKNRGPGRGNK